jgi:hypothetical protein
VTHVLLDTARRPRRRPGRLPAPETARQRGPLDLVTGAAHAGLYAARHPGRLRDAFFQAKSMADVVDGKVFFGLNADRDATDLDTAAEGMETAIAELVELAASGHAVAALS